jgi:DNA-binding SARP family transcriptional activator
MSVLSKCAATLDALVERVNALRTLIDERDVRYNQRFQAQQEALTAALSAAKEAVAAALLAADRAVSKAELAAEKRFESVNEFRGALSDQTAKLLPRVEADARFSNLEEKINRLDKADAGRSGGEIVKDNSGRVILLIIGIVMSGFFSFISILLGATVVVLRLTGH